MVGTGQRTEKAELDKFAQMPRSQSWQNQEFRQQCLSNQGEQRTKLIFFFYFISKV